MTEYLKAVQVAKELKIKTSTLRKYAMLLEKYNYTFPRDYANHRLYGPEQVEMIKNLQLTKENPSLNLVEAAKILTEEYRVEEQHSVVISLEEWETMKREQDLRDRVIAALSDIIENLAKEVFQDRMEEWGELIDEVHAKYFKEDEDSAESKAL